MDLSKFRYIEDNPKRQDQHRSRHRNKRHEYANLDDDYIDEIKYDLSKRHQRRPRSPSPPPRPPPKDAFVQSWLQQTQLSRSRPRESDDERPTREKFRANGARHRSGKKRERSESRHVPHSPEPQELVEEHSSKRPRHKTRPEKYDYKHGVGHITRLGQEEPALAAPYSRREVENTGRKPRNPQIPVHIPRDSRDKLKSSQANKYGDYREANHLSKNRSKDEKLADSNAKNRKGREEDQENRELEELEAFFSRRNGRRTQDGRHLTPRHYRVPSDDYQDDDELLVDSQVRKRLKDLSRSRQELERSPRAADVIGQEPCDSSTYHLSHSRDDELATNTLPSSKSTTYFTWSVSDRNRDPKDTIRRSPLNVHEKNAPSSSRDSHLRIQASENRKYSSPVIRRPQEEKHNTPRRVIYKDAGSQTCFEVTANPEPKSALKPSRNLKQVTIVDDNARDKELGSLNFAEETSLPMSNGSVAQTQTTKAARNSDLTGPLYVLSRVQPRTRPSGIAEDWYMLDAGDAEHTQIPGRSYRLGGASKMSQLVGAGLGVSRPEHPLSGRQVMDNRLLPSSHEGIGIRNCTTPRVDYTERYARSGVNWLQRSQVKPTQMERAVELMNRRDVNIYDANNFQITPTAKRSDPAESMKAYISRIEREAFSGPKISKIGDYSGDNKVDVVGYAIRDPTEADEDLIDQHGGNNTVSLDEEEWLPVEAADSSAGTQAFLDVASPMQLDDHILGGWEDPDGF